MLVRFCHLPMQRCVSSAPDFIAIMTDEFFFFLSQNNYAIDIVDTCGLLPQYKTLIACGHEFDSDRYNVIVRADNC